MLSGLIPAFIVFVSLFIPLGVVFAVRYRERQRKRSPLSQHLLRSPGESLRNELDDRMWDLAGYLMFMPLVPLVLYAAQLRQALVTGGTLRISGLVVVVGLLGFGFFFYKAFTTMRKVWKLRLGYEAELAMGQELDQLMRQGAVVFHDVPAEGFNIDHVLVAPNGVFAIETKGRSKPNRDRGAEDAKVTVDGKSLSFPGWVETKPLEQACAQARWLSKWLTSAVGEPVTVKPVLALPGWYVDRKGRGDALVISGREASSILKAKQEALPESMIKRIEHQLEQRCRDVEPSMYKKRDRITK
jgi:hypothetical protein